MSDDADSANRARRRPNSALGSVSQFPTPDAIPDRRREVSIIVCPEVHAAKVGEAVFRGGGNAVDAAIAAAFVQGVENPFACGIGGGISLYYWSGQKRSGTYVKAESMLGSAPFPANRLAKADEHDVGYQSIGVPGFIEGCREAYERWGSGRISWRDLLAPAVSLARDGFEVGRGLQRQWDYVVAGDKLRNGQPRLQTTAAAQKIYYHRDGRPIQQGERLVQDDLANTLRRIADAGGRDFYDGAIATTIAADFAANDGLITAADLAAYDAELDEPLRGGYKGLVIEVQPFSNGGYFLEALQILERFDLTALGHNSPAYIDLVSKAMRAAWADYCHVSDLERDEFRPHEDGNISLARTEHWVNLIRDGDSITTPDRSSPAGGTTHLHSVDDDGNIVSHNHSIGAGGSGVVTEGLGFLYNNDANDAGFPGTRSPRRFIGGGSPVMFFKNGKPHLVVGAPGGTRIETSVLQSALNVIEFGLDMQTAVTTPRFHSEDTRAIFLEHTIREDVAEELRRMGNDVLRNRYHARPQGLLWRADTASIEAGSDPRVGIAVGIDPPYDWASDFGGRFGQGKPPH